MPTPPPRRTSRSPSPSPSSRAAPWPASRARPAPARASWSRPRAPILPARPRSPRERSDRREADAGHAGRRALPRAGLGLRGEVRRHPHPRRQGRLARRLGSDGFKAFEAARERGLEGIVAKDEASTYETGKRSPAWRKVKVRAEEEFVIGGYTAPEGARTHFGALLIGAFDDGTLRYAGKVGTGFTSKTLADLAQRFAPLRRATSPFADAPRMRDATWPEPRPVAPIGFMEN